MLPFPPACTGIKELCVLGWVRRSACVQVVLVLVVLCACTCTLATFALLLFAIYGHQGYMDEVTTEGLLCASIPGKLLGSIVFA